MAIHEALIERIDVDRLSLRRHSIRTVRAARMAPVTPRNSAALILNRRVVPPRSPTWFSESVTQRWSLASSCAWVFATFAPG
jgi:hypothetical protein